MPPSRATPRQTSGTSGSRRFHDRAGRRGEAWAALYLGLKRYRILARRVKTPVGEIDLIARRGDLIVIVEVKARGFSHQEAEALGAVNRRRIVRATRLWLGRHPDLAGQPLRFDVIFLAPFAWPRHIQGAFDASGIA